MLRRCSAAYDFALVWRIAMFDIVSHRENILISSGAVREKTSLREGRADIAGLFARPISLPDGWVSSPGLRRAAVMLAVRSAGSVAVLLGAT